MPNYFFLRLKKTILTGITCSLFIACGSDNGKAPKNLVSKDKMASILAEIHLKESVINNYNIPNADTNAFIFKTFEAEIFKKNNVDSSTYADNYKYYMVNPKEYIEVYKLVVEKIKAQNKIDSLAALKNRPKYGYSHPKDSLKRISADSARTSVLKQKLDSVRSRVLHGK